VARARDAGGARHRRRRAVRDRRSVERSVSFAWARTIQVNPRAGRFSTGVVCFPTPGGFGGISGLSGILNVAPRRRGVGSRAASQEPSARPRRDTPGSRTSPVARLLGIARVARAPDPERPPPASALGASRTRRRRARSRKSARLLGRDRSRAGACVVALVAFPRGGSPALRSRVSALPRARATRPPRVSRWRTSTPRAARTR
jgi:hypothetical protein